MAAGGGNLHRPLHALLAFDLGEIHLLLVPVLEQRGDVHRGRGDGGLPFEEAGGFAQVVNGDDLQAGDHRRLGGVLRRDQDPNLAFRPRAQGNGQHPFDRTHPAVQGQLAHDHEVFELVGFSLFAGRHHADGDGQVEARPLFFHVRRGQVDGGAAEGEIEPGIDEGGHDPVAGFFHRGVRQADDDNNSVAIPGVDFHLDRICLDAVDGSRTDLGQHASSYGADRGKGQRRNGSEGVAAAGAVRRIAERFSKPGEAGG